ncbi:hypothetical protein [Mycolicibacterium sp. PDY-3]|uniref:hypothetical protein n=1 Tax=Mycolicibacterium sp. PDY-3 TaxID=3376069 RepID=UPI0037899CD4
MPAAVDQCPQGHDTQTASDRDAQGHCRKCKAERERRRRVSTAMKLTLIKAFEDVGVRFEDDDGRPVAPTDVVRQLVEIYQQ